MSSSALPASFRDGLFDISTVRSAQLSALGGDVGSVNWKASDDLDQRAAELLESEFFRRRVLSRDDHEPVSQCRDFTHEGFLENTLFPGISCGAESPCLA